jgi:hypothetical protein
VRTGARVPDGCTFRKLNHPGTFFLLQIGPPDDRRFPSLGWPVLFDKMNGFVVEILRSFDGRVPSVWLSENDGSTDVASDRKAAKVFKSESAAHAAALEYCDAHRGRIANFLIHRR